MKTTSGLRLGISVPQNFPEERVDLGHVRDYIRRAEQIGFDDCWLTENILSSNFQLEPVAYLSYVAALTERIRLGVAIVILNTRNPVQLAKALASVDQLSNGRFILGVGIGAGTRNYAAFGIPEERRVARFEEAIAVIKALWTQDSATLGGDFWKLEGARMLPKPIQKPHIPIIFGGHADAALRRAVKLGDGWMAAGSISTEQSIDSLKQIRGFLEEAGRDESRFMLSKRLYVAVDDDEARARAKLSEALSHQYGARDYRSMGVAGAPGRIAEEIGRIREAGAHHLVLNVLYDHLEQMEAVTARVVPQL
jgi:probable F420-dependent oxidoreductase